MGCLHGSDGPQATTAPVIPAPASSNSILLITMAPAGATAPIIGAVRCVGFRLEEGHLLTSGALGDGDLTWHDRVRDDQIR
jgi:hypothetical protein